MRRVARKTYGLVGILMLLVIVFHYLGWLAPVESMFRSLIFPSIKNANAIGVKVANEYRWFRNKSDFMESYDLCIQNALDESILTARLSLLEGENKELREQLFFFKDSDVKYLVAQVVGRGAVSGSDTIIIDKGSSNGVDTEQAVIAGQGVIVGKITKTEPDSAVVTLIDDNRSKLGAAILNRDKSVGVVEGGYGISLRLKFIPRNETVLVGDQVVTSGLEKTIPRGLLIGSVAAVENEAYKPFQQAVITSAVDLSKLIVVSVLVNH